MSHHHSLNFAPSLMKATNKILSYLTLLFAQYFRVSEAWVGVKYVEGKWMWENGMEATEQRYFRDEPFNNISSTLCGKAVFEQKTRNIRKLYIRQEDCSTKLPVICQFSKLTPCRRKGHYYNYFYSDFVI